MRRKDRTITDPNRIEAVLDQALVCRLAMVDGDRPYIVPLCFGYADKRLYCHCATSGRKLDILERNRHVCFEVEAGVALLPAEEACGWSMDFASIIGFGQASLVHDPAAKRTALDIIMRHYDKTGRAYTYPDDVLAKTLIIRVDVEELTGKQKGTP